MATEAQRSAMLSAMGIDIYRLRAAPVTSAPLRIALDGRSQVCVDGDDESSARLLAVLPSVLGVARERVTRDAVDDAAAIAVDACAMHGGAAAKRALWQALKPLARRLHGTS